MLDAFASSGSSPTLRLIVLLVIDLVAWFFLVRFLQWFSGRRQPHVAAPSEPEWYTKVPATRGRAVIFFPVGEEDENGNTPILLMTVEANGNTKAERAISHRAKPGPQR